MKISMVLFQNLTIHEWEVRNIVQNGSSIAVNAGGLNTKSDNGVVGKSVAAGGSGNGVDQNRFAQREDALTKFWQKRKERCFEKKAHGGATTALWAISVQPYQYGAFNSVVSSSFLEAFRGSMNWQSLMRKSEAVVSLYLIIMHNVASRLNEGFHSISKINILKTQLLRTFDMKDLGVSKRVLGINIHRDKKKSKFQLFQAEYLENVLIKCEMDKSKLKQDLSMPLTNHSMPSRARELFDAIVRPFDAIESCLMPSTAA
ncbi:uncharacterized protein LOC131220185 [Magnolia sinica]|uniref:uncharacterized protein LOC131220185 n=1 Tax=Magnolia sinica TaxID=86752 RepID=UPI0026592F60|nr:uncharacterized protein LOC131220185 [Magnolia sinica]